MDRRRSQSPFDDADPAPAEASMAVSKRPGSRGTYLLCRVSGPTVDDDGYEWDFGDGTTAVSDGPWASHVYGSAGEYTVAVSVTDADVASDPDATTDSDSVAATRTVTVADEPTALGMEGPDRVGVGETVTLAASVPPELEDAGLTWYDYDERRETAGPTFERTFDEPGGYEVALEATGVDGGTETVMRTVAVVDRAPTARIDAPDRAAVGTAVSFDGSSSGAPNGGVAEYAWHDRERDLTFDTEGFRCVLDRAGEYTVELTVTGPDGATDTATHTVTVVDGATTARTESTAPTDSTASTDATAPTDSTASTDAPDRGGAEQAHDTPVHTDTGTEAGPTARIDAPDRVAVGETVTMDGEVSEAPGEVVEYEWHDFEDRPLGVGASGFECTFAEPGDYRYRLTVTDDTGAVDATDHTVTVTNDHAGAAAEVVVSRWAEATPRGSYVLFENAEWPEVGDPTLTHEWDFGDGTTAVADGPYASHVYDAPGEYTVELTVTDDDGATATDARTVRVGDDRGPVARIDAPDEVAAGRSLTIDGSGSEAPGGIAEYAWYDYDRPEFARVGAELESFERTVADPGEYWFRLRVTDTEGRADVARHRLRVREE